jgi:hypothetical protein
MKLVAEPIVAKLITLVINYSSQYMLNIHYTEKCLTSESSQEFWSYKWTDG